MSRIVLAVVAVLLVNLPWANDLWVQHRIDSAGVQVQAVVVKDAQKHGGNFLSYRLPKQVDASQTLYGAEVSSQAYREATASGHISARVVPGHPSQNRLEGQVTGPLVAVIALIGDAIIALLVWFSVRRHRRWTRFTVTETDGDVVTVRSGGQLLSVVLADDPDTVARLHPAVGSKLVGALYLVPSGDVVDGPPLGEFTHLSEADYRIAGRVRAVTQTRTDILLDNGYLMAVINDEVEHEAELRGPATATGQLTLAFRRPR